MEVSSERYKKILGENFKSPTDLTIRSVRTNTLKISPENLEHRLEESYQVDRIPWMDGGFWVKNSDRFTKSMEHVLGYFFVQDASSMIPPIVLDPKEGESVLDISAAPGSKTTQMAAMMNNKGIIVANDLNYERLKALRGNLQRCGVVNTVVTKQKGENFWKTGVKFDKILVDAPCTGTGTMNPRILKETSESSIRYFSEVQKQILQSAIKCLKDDGTMVYSTCSLEPEENEIVMDFAVKELGMKIENIDMNFPKGDTRNAILEWDDKKVDKSISKSIRAMPSERKEGFFICKLKI